MAGERVISLEADEHITDLGEGEYNGQPALAEYGDERTFLRWNDDPGIWLSEAEPSVVMRDLDRMVDRQNTPSDTIWFYLSTAITETSLAYGWQPQSLRRADLAYEMGMIMQEKISAVFSCNEADSVYQLAVVWYGFDQGETISPLIVADSVGSDRNVGLELSANSTQRTFRTIEWANSPIGTPVKPFLAPHVYTRYASGDPGTDGCTLEYIKAERRWAGDPS